MKPVQNYAKNFIVKELREKAQTDLDIKNLYFRPFNTVGLDSVYINNPEGDTILVAGNISASIDLFELLKQNIVVSTTRLSDFSVHLSKYSQDSTLNIQFLIDAFSSKEKKKESKLKFQINAVNLSNGNFSYNVLDLPKISNNRFDKNHISVSNLHAKIALKSLQSDSLNLQIRKLGLKEKSGFEITNLLGRLITKNNHASLKGFELLLPDSKIEFGRLDLVLPASLKKDTLHSHEDDIKIDFELAESYISLNDISAFVPQFKGINEKAYIKSSISGYEHNVKMTDLDLKFGDKLQLKANAELIDWFDGGDTYLLTTIDELRVSGKDIEDIANIFSIKEVKLPKGIAEQKNILFQGDLSGYLTQLTAFGSLDTDDGIIRTDLLLGFDKKEKFFSFIKGKIYTTDFQLGNFLQNKNLGNTSFNIALDMNKRLHREFEGTVRGEVHDFFFKDYLYNDIQIDAAYKNKKLDGSFAINTENGDLSFSGFLDRSGNLPELNFTADVNNIQLDKLNLVEKLANSYLSLNINANFIGSDIDNAQGYISVDSLEMYKDEQLFKINEFNLRASGLSATKDRNIELKSDLISGYILGESTLLDLAKSFKYTLHQYLPALFPQDSIKSSKLNNFRYHFEIANTEELSSMFQLPVIVYEPAVINGFYRNEDNKFKIDIRTPHIKAGGTKILSGLVQAEDIDGSISTTIKTLIEGKNQVLNDITVNSNGKEDRIKTTIDLTNTSKARAEGSFSFLTQFEHPSEEEGLITKINLDESKLLLNNAKWILDKSTIIIDKKRVEINNFNLHTQDSKQELKIGGKYSQYDSSNILKAQLKDIDLSYIFETLAIDALKFGGGASGNLFVSSIEGKPYANTRLNVKDFEFHGTHLGNLDLFSELNEETNEVMMSGLITSKENKKTTVEGTIDPIKQELSINFDADSIDISFLHAYAESIFSKVSGRGTGQIHLHGDFSNVTVEGIANIIDGNIGIKFLNTDYTFSDVVYLKEGLIYFNDIAFKDQYGNIAKGNGKIVHNYFQDIMYHIEFNANNFLVYNATEQHNPIFFGKVYGSGKGIIGGDEKEVNIDINMQTKENTLVRMNFMEEEVSEYSFITYVEPDPETHEDKHQRMAPIKTDSEMNINMNFYIDATPDATFELVMDPVGGDILRGSGSGAMQFVWSSKLEPQLYGTYNVTKGDYNFTFQRIMTRKFSIQEGSTVQFQGDPFQALLDVNAIYKVTATLSDLDNELVKQSGQASIPVHCILNLTGQLKRPNVRLDIDFPTANADVERQIKSYMDTEDMINKQVAYLLLMSKFYTPDDGRVDHPSSDFTVVASATLSSQLTKIISQIDSRWQIGTHIRLNDTDMSNKEIELIMSSRLLNDRLLINGNFGYRDNPFLKQDAVITDIDIEYLLNSSGTWRIKAYNHYNEKFYYLQDNKGVQTQGVGLMYRKDFDKVSDLFPWRRKKVEVVSDTLQSILPNSLQKGSELSDFVKFRKK